MITHMSRYATLVDRRALAGCAFALEEGGASVAKPVDVRFFVCHSALFHSYRSMPFSSCFPFCFFIFLSANDCFVVFRMYVLGIQLED